MYDCREVFSEAILSKFESCEDSWQSARVTSLGRGFKLGSANAFLVNVVHVLAFYHFGLNLQHSGTEASSRV